MRKIRGFKLGRRLIRISRWILKKTRNRKGYHRLGSPDCAATKSMAMAKILTWGRKLTRGARSLCAVKPGSGYSPMGSDPEREERRAVPKGKLAVYVGQKEEGEFQRVLVPVIYFNHPLFGELLREAEEEYGFNHPGGITIPCRFTEFERVKTRIASGSGGGSGRRLAWRWHY